VDHHTTWLSFLPGYAAFEAFVRSIQPAGLLGTPVVVQHVLAAALTALFVLFLAWRTHRSLTAGGTMEGLVPGPEVSVRNVVEVLAEMLLRQMKQIIGPEATRYFPVLFTLTLFILFSNLLGLVPGFTPPTDNWNTTFACSIFVFVYFNYHGLRVHKWGHITHLANPVGEWWGWFLAPLMFPLETVSMMVRPVSLGIRLGANMLGDHAVLGAFVGLLPFFLPIPIMALGLLVCVVQTTIFVVLTMIYLKLSVQETH